MKKLFSKSFIVGAGFGLGLAAVAAIAVTVGTVKTWTSGETLTSSDLNSTISSLKTALETIPNWTKSGTSAVYTDGNVGIGTSSPPSLLSLGNQGNIGEASPSTLLRFDNRYDGVGNTTANKVVFFDSAGSRFGIGISTADFDLFSGSNFRFYANHADETTQGTEAFTILSSGNVGIGATSPSQKLDVNGSINLASNLYSAGTKIYLFGGTYSPSGGTYCNAINNPLTGGQTCPSGFTAYIMSTSYCEPTGGSSRTIYVCVK